MAPARLCAGATSWPAVQAAAISHGRIQDIYEHAAGVMHF